MALLGNIHRVKIFDGWYFLRKNEVFYDSERDRRTEKVDRIARLHGR